MRKTMILCAILNVLAFFMPGRLSAHSFEELVGAEQAAALRTQGSITEVQLKNPVHRLLPRHDGLRLFVNELTGSLNPSLCVETLFLYKKPFPPQTAAESDLAEDGVAEPGVWSDAERAALFNQVVAISSLAGTQYYSASRGVMRTFYESSFVVEDPSSRRALPDPVYSSPPSALTLYTRQKDLTFGNNVYRYDYRCTTDSFFFVQENLTTLTAGIIPAVSKNKLRSIFAVIDCGDYLLIYISSMAKAASVPGMDERIGNSFSNRAEAIVKWFTARADSVLEKQ